jgi:hypothetical protein
MRIFPTRGIFTLTERFVYKASGPDKISHKMLKISPEKIAIPLQIIFNKSLRQCKYPSSWKNAHVFMYQTFVPNFIESL